jgi:hypothetical protein
MERFVFDFFEVLLYRVSFGHYPLDRSGFLVPMDQNVRQHGNQRTRKEEHNHI